MKTNKVKNTKIKEIIIKFSLSITFTIFAVILFNWGITEIKSPTPFGVISNSFLSDVKILGIWFLLSLLSVILVIPFVLLLKNTLHKYARNRLTITNIFPDSTHENRIVVTASFNGQKTRKYLLLSEVTDNSVFVMDLSTFKLFFAKLDTNIPLEKIKETKNMPKKLQHSLHRIAWNKK